MDKNPLHALELMIFTVPTQKISLRYVAKMLSHTLDPPDITDLEWSGNPAAQ